MRAASSAGFGEGAGAGGGDGGGDGDGDGAGGVVGAGAGEDPAAGEPSADVGGPTGDAVGSALLAHADAETETKMAAVRARPVERTSMGLLYDSCMVAASPL